MFWDGYDDFRVPPCGRLCDLGSGTAKGGPPVCALSLQTSAPARMLPVGSSLCTLEGPTALGVEREWVLGVGLGPEQDSKARGPAKLSRRDAAARRDEALLRVL